MVDEFLVPLNRERDVGESGGEKRLVPLNSRACGTLRSSSYESAVRDTPKSSMRDSEQRVTRCRRFSWILLRLGWVRLCVLSNLVGLLAVCVLWTASLA